MSRLDQFLAFSSEVTAFTVFELNGTGQAQAYLSAVADAAGEDALNELLGTYERFAGETEKGPTRDGLLRKAIFGSEKLGPVARNIIKMWYTGMWFELPREWTDSFGARDTNTTFIVNGAAYAEGLLWPAIGANPPGAKAPGYASWTQPPKIPSEF